MSQEDSNHVRGGTAALIQRLKDHWLQGGVKIRSGVSREQIEAFEHTHDVELPPDLRECFAAINGMDDDTGSEDFCFLPLEAVRSLPAVLGEHGHLSVHHRIMEGLPEPHRWFVIVDYLVSSAVFAIRLSGTQEGNPVLAYSSDYPIVAASYSELLETYLTAPMTLLSSC